MALVAAAVVDVVGSASTGRIRGTFRDHFRIPDSGRKAAAKKALRQGYSVSDRRHQNRRRWITPRPYPSGGSFPADEKN